MGDCSHRSSLIQASPGYSYDYLELQTRLTTMIALVPENPQIVSQLFHSLDFKQDSLGKMVVLRNLHATIGQDSLKKSTFLQSS